MQTLAELKAENAKAENADVETENAEIPQIEAKETETEAAKDETVEGQQAAEPEDEKTEESIDEGWMQSDEPESQADKKFTDGDIGAAKAKLRAKLERKHDSEVEGYKAEIEELKRGKPDVQERPKRENYYDSDDPEGDFIDALTDWKIANSQTQQAERVQQQAHTQQQETRQSEVNQAVDQHYERAVKLADSSGISAELYKSSDLMVRQVVESVMSGNGDAVTDSLIANLGEGSEKVFYNLGVNAAKREQFRSLLQSDPSGIKASMYLGRLQAELAAPQKRKTNAPKPATQIKGDEQANDNHRALRTKYEKAHKNGDYQAAFSARREAKKAGANLSTW